MLADHDGWCGRSGLFPKPKRASAYDLFASTAATRANLFFSDRLFASVHW
jgi:hypothetical protein